MCPRLSLRMARRFYLVCRFLMDGLGCVKKDSEAVRRLSVADVLCAACYMFVLSAPAPWASGLAVRCLRSGLWPVGAQEGDSDLSGVLQVSVCRGYWANCPKKLPEPWGYGHHITPRELTGEQ